MGRSELEAGEGLVLRPCRAVHMAWMSFPLDVAFLNGRGEVVATYHALAPGARSDVPELGDPSCAKRCARVRQRRALPRKLPMTFEKPASKRPWSTLAIALIAAGVAGA